MTVTDIQTARAKKAAATCPKRRTRPVAVYAQGGVDQDDRLLAMCEVERMTSAKKSWIYDRIGRGQFPRPIRLCAGRRVAWSLKAIQAWIASQTAAVSTTPITEQGASNE